MALHHDYSKTIKHQAAAISNTKSKGANLLAAKSITIKQQSSKRTRLKHVGTKTTKEDFNERQDTVQLIDRLFNTNAAAATTTTNNYNDTFARRHHRRQIDPSKWTLQTIDNPQNDRGHQYMQAINVAGATTTTTGPSSPPPMLLLRATSQQQQQVAAATLPTAVIQNPSSSFLLLFALLVMINLVVILGNILVIVAVYASAKLRNVTNIFIVSLATADLMLGILVLPYALLYEVFDVWMFGSVWCRGWLVTDVWISTASILNLCAISIDRYVAVTRPVKYRSIMTNRRARSIVAIVWLLSFIICFPPLLTELRPSSSSSSKISVNVLKDDDLRIINSSNEIIGDNDNNNIPINDDKFSKEKNSQQHIMPAKIMSHKSSPERLNMNELRQTFDTYSVVENQLKNHRRKRQVTVDENVIKIPHAASVEQVLLTNNSTTTTSTTTTTTTNTNTNHANKSSTAYNALVFVLTKENFKQEEWHCDKFEILLTFVFETTTTHRNVDPARVKRKLTKRNSNDEVDQSSGTTTRAYANEGKEDSVLASTKLDNDDICDMCISFRLVTSDEFLSARENKRVVEVPRQSISGGGGVRGGASDTSGLGIGENELNEQNKSARRQGANNNAIPSLASNFAEQLLLSRRATSNSVKEAASRQQQQQPVSMQVGGQQEDTNKKRIGKTKLRIMKRERPNFTFETKASAQNAVEAEYKYLLLLLSSSKFVVANKLGKPLRRSLSNIVAVTSRNSSEYEHNHHHHHQQQQQTELLVVVKLFCDNNNNNNSDNMSIEIKLQPNGKLNSASATLGIFGGGRCRKLLSSSLLCAKCKCYKTTNKTLNRQNNVCDAILTLLASTSALPNGCGKSVVVVVAVVVVTSSDLKDKQSFGENQRNIKWFICKHSCRHSISFKLNDKHDSNDHIYDDSIMLFVCGYALDDGDERESLTNEELKKGAQLLLSFNCNTNNNLTSHLLSPLNFTNECDENSLCNGECLFATIKQFYYGMQQQNSTTNRCLAPFYCCNCTLFVQTNKKLHTNNNDAKLKSIDKNKFIYNKNTSSPTKQSNNKPNSPTTSDDNEQKREKGEEDLIVWLDGFSLDDANMLLYGIASSYWKLWLARSIATKNNDNQDEHKNLMSVRSTEYAQDALNRLRRVGGGVVNEKEKSDKMNGGNERQMSAHECAFCHNGLPTTTTLCARLANVTTTTGHKNVSSFVCSRATLAAAAAANATRNNCAIGLRESGFVLIVVSLISATNSSGCAQPNLKLLLVEQQQSATNKREERIIIAKAPITICAYLTCSTAREELAHNFNPNPSSNFVSASSRKLQREAAAAASNTRGARIADDLHHRQGQTWPPTSSTTTTTRLAPNVDLRQPHTNGFDATIDYGRRWRQCVGALVVIHSLDSDDDDDDGGGGRGTKSGATNRTRSLWAIATPTITIAPPANDPATLEAAAEIRSAPSVLVATGQLESIELLATTTNKIKCDCVVSGMPLSSLSELNQGGAAIGRSLNESQVMMIRIIIPKLDCTQKLAKSAFNDKEEGKNKTTTQKAQREDKLAVVNGGDKGTIKQSKEHLGANDEKQKDQLAYILCTRRKRRASGGQQQKQVNNEKIAAPLVCRIDALEQQHTQTSYNCSFPKWLLTINPNNFSSLQLYVLFNNHTQDHDHEMQQQQQQHHVDHKKLQRNKRQSTYGVKEMNNDNNCDLFHDKTYVIYSSLGSFYIPMLIMVFFYSRIYLVASRAQKAMQRGYMTTKWPPMQTSSGAFKRANSIKKGLATITTTMTTMTTSSSTTLHGGGNAPRHERDLNKRSINSANHNERIANETLAKCQHNTREADQCHAIECNECQTTTASDQSPSGSLKRNGLRRGKNSASKCYSTPPERVMLRIHRRTEPPPQQQQQPDHKQVVSSPNHNHNHACKRDQFNLNTFFGQNSEQKSIVSRASKSILLSRDERNIVKLENKTSNDSTASKQSMLMQLTAIEQQQQQQQQIPKRSAQHRTRFSFGETTTVTTRDNNSINERSEMFALKGLESSSLRRKRSSLPPESVEQFVAAKTVHDDDKALVTQDSDGKPVCAADTRKSDEALECDRAQHQKRHRHHSQRHHHRNKQHHHHHHHHHNGCAHKHSADKLTVDESKPNIASQTNDSIQITISNYDDDDGDEQQATSLVSSTSEHMNKGHNNSDTGNSSCKPHASATVLVNWNAAQGAAESQLAATVSSTIDAEEEENVDEKKGVNIVEHDEDRRRRRRDSSTSPLSEQLLAVSQRASVVEHKQHQSYTGSGLSLVANIPNQVRKQSIMLLSTITTRSTQTLRRLSIAAAHPVDSLFKSNRLSLRSGRYSAADARSSPSDFSSTSDDDDDDDGTGKLNAIDVEAANGGRQRHEAKRRQTTCDVKKEKGFKKKVIHTRATKLRRASCSSPISHSASPAMSPRKTFDDYLMAVAGIDTSSSSSSLANEEEEDEEEDDDDDDDDDEFDSNTTSDDCSPGNNLTAMLRRENMLIPSITIVSHDDEVIENKLREIMHTNNTTTTSVTPTTTTTTTRSIVSVVTPSDDKNKEKQKSMPTTKSNNTAIADTNAHKQQQSNLNTNSSKKVLLFSAPISACHSSSNERQITDYEKRAKRTDCLPPTHGLHRQGGLYESATSQRAHSIELMRNSNGRLQALMNDNSNNKNTLWSASSSTSNLSLFERVGCHSVDSKRRQVEKSRGELDDVKFSTVQGAADARNKFNSTKKSARASSDLFELHDRRSEIQTNQLVSSTLATTKTTSTSTTTMTTMSTTETNPNDQLAAATTTRRRGAATKRTSRWHAKRLRAETKAAKTVAIIVGGFIFCWLPFFTAYLSRAIICKTPDCVPQTWLSLFTWLGYLNSAINPVIYGLFSADFRHAFKNIVCQCRLRSSSSSLDASGNRMRLRLGGNARGGGGGDGESAVVSTLVDNIIKSIL